MRVNVITRVVGPLLIATMTIVTVNVNAECLHRKLIPRPPDAEPVLDGPGSFAKLQGTVTLDCLRYVGSIQRDGKEHVFRK
jgi:hypothetical protein